MLKEFTQFIRKTAAQMFTWPSRYRSERLGPLETVAGQAVTPESALTCSTVAACVRLLSETMASLPLHVYRDLEQSKVIAADHPAYDVLHSSPNDFQTNYTWMRETSNGIRAAIPSSSGPLHPHGIILEAVDGTVRYKYYCGQA